jgi:phenylpropionate dioxygenase-like ring-hydroxylating dioxygenase large terminal subunit
MLNDPILINEWHVVALAEHLPPDKPLGVRLLDEDIVVWRVGDQILAWQDLCVHRGTKLSLGKIGADDTLTCPYHGWVYNTQGRCVLLPAHPDQTPPERARVKSYRAVERYGWIWVSLGDPQHDIPEFREWDDQSFRKIWCGPYHFHAAAPRVIENFLDVAHFPFVHEGYLGDPQHTEMTDYEAVISEDGITSENIQVWQPDPDGTGIGKHVAYTYRVLRPLNAYFIKQHQQQFSIFFAVTPIAELESEGWMWMNMNYGYDIPEADLRNFQDVVSRQDIPIVESQRPERLPLDLQTELHLKSDRTAIAYRRWLRQLGVTIGTG